jgi:hypothetical protein
MGIQIPHKAVDFKKNEIKTLEYIYKRGFFDSDFSELAIAISTTWERYRGNSFKKNFNFEFVSDFEIEIEKQIHRIVLHAQVIGEYDTTTYSIGICAQDGSYELIRRFHFDYIHDNHGKKQKVPISHLQYGGKSGNGFDGKPFQTNNIEPGLSVPRLNFPPINIALLLDVTLCEFHTEQTEKIVENSEWRSLIKNNEDFLLSHYYHFIASHIHSHHHNKEKLIRDICYGY